MNTPFVHRNLTRGLLLPALILFGLLTGLGCREAKTDPTQMERVIAIHDSVMPRMPEIARLVARLKPLADSTAQGREYQEAMEDLQEAHGAMMDWMKGFGDRFDYAETMEGKELSPQKQEWLREEEVRVKAMAGQVNSSIERARALLENE